MGKENFAEAIMDPNSPVGMHALQEAGRTGPGSKLLANGMDIRCLRPYIGSDGRCYQDYVTVNAAGQVEVKNKLVANATLRFVEWKQYDTAVIREARQRLVITDDLIAKGCGYTLSNGMAKTVLESENLAEFNPAEMSMDGVTRGNDDRPNFELVGIPLPFIHKGYTIGIRALNISRNTGDPLDTTSAELATRVVSEKVESITISGTSNYKFGGSSYIIYGLTDYPYINTVDLAANWDASGVTASDILADVRSMKQALITDRFYGPYTLYVSGNYSTVLDDDYSVSGASLKSIRQRILDIEGIQDVKVVDGMTDDTVLLVQTTPDVIRIINGMPVTPVEWSEEGGMIMKHKVMTIRIPQVRSTQAGRCGVCYLRAA